MIIGRCDTAMSWQGGETRNMELTTTVSFSGKSINLHWSLMKAFSGRIPPNLKTRIVNFFFLDTQTPFFVFTLYKIYPPKRYEMKRYLVNITMHCWVKLRPSRFTLCKRPQCWQRRGLIATERPGRLGRREPGPSWPGPGHRYTNTRLQATWAFCLLFFFE